MIPSWESPILVGSRLLIGARDGAPAEARPTLRGSRKSIQHESELSVRYTPALQVAENHGTRPKFSMIQSNILNFRVLNNDKRDLMNIDALKN